MTNWLSKMQRGFFPLLAAALIATGLLRKLGIISAANLKYSLILPALLETVFLIVLFFNLARIIRKYKTLKKDGWEALDAVQKALELVFPAQVARLAMIEPRLYHTLYLSYKCKPNKIDLFTTRIHNYELLVKVLLLLCLLEIGVVFWLLPDQWMFWKIIHLLIGLWAILWLWADYRAMGLYHHRITMEGIRFRLGLRYDGKIPWEDIGQVQRIHVSPPDGAMAPKIARNQPGCFYMGAGEICNMEINLKKPCRIEGMFSDFKGVTRLLLSLDNPEAFMAGIRLLQPGLCGVVE